MAISTRKHLTKVKVQSDINIHLGSPLENARLIKEKVSKARRAYHATLHSHLAEAYHDIPALTATEEPWIEFCEAAEWRGRVGPKPTDDLGDRCRYVALFIFGSDDENMADRARKYGRVLEHYVRKHVHPNEFAKRLKADGGVEAVLKREVQENPRRQASAKSDDEEPGERESRLTRHTRSLRLSEINDGDRVNDDDLDPDLNDDDDGSAEKPARRQSSAVAPLPSLPRSDKTLLVGVSNDEFEDFMNLEPGGEIRMTVRRFSYPGKLKILHASTVTKVPRNA